MSELLSKESVNRDEILKNRVTTHETFNLILKKYHDALVETSDKSDPAQKGKLRQRYAKRAKE
ncbi:MAG: hypothetical protein ACN4E2_02885 [Nitrospinota bacterium]